MSIGYKYNLIAKIGNGNFGTIFKGVNIRTGEEVAIKVESFDAQTKLLKREAQIYQYIGILKGFPQVKWFGSDNTHYYMVLDLFGKSLTDAKELGSIQNCCHSVSIQMIDRIESLHKLNLIHRDIKPDNFMFGLNENSNTLFLIDYGLCRSYLDDSGAHINMCLNKNVIGTPNFVSSNVKKGVEPSRRDDLISCINIMIFLLDGPNEYTDKLMEYALLLRFEEEPDYKLCKMWLAT